MFTFVEMPAMILFGLQNPPLYVPVGTEWTPDQWEWSIKRAPHRAVGGRHGRDVGRAHEEQEEH
jgi:hypothetical protein